MYEKAERTRSPQNWITVKGESTSIAETAPILQGQVIIPIILLINKFLSLFVMFFWDKNGTIKYYQVETSLREHLTKVQGFKKRCLRVNAKQVIESTTTKEYTDSQGRLLVIFMIFQLYCRLKIYVLK